MMMMSITADTSQHKNIFVQKTKSQFCKLQNIGLALKNHDLFIGNYSKLWMPSIKGYKMVATYT
jgi:hypothetical protein